MLSSSVSLVRDLFTPSEYLDHDPTDEILNETVSSGKTSSAATIASRFKTSLASLHHTLLSTSPHYVRCIKPNTLKKPLCFDHQMILSQLLYSGVLECVRIRREGFPTRVCLSFCSYLSSFSLFILITILIFV